MCVVIICRTAYVREAVVLVRVVRVITYIYIPVRVLLPRVAHSYSYITSQLLLVYTS